jgi:SWI/SNF-related matrix-associated actin-dependent regulator of chromatin subfamily A member 5
MACWDGGNLTCCEYCPASYHLECLAEDLDQVTKVSFWACPHHACATCGRKAAATGGLLFRCEMCPNSFCEVPLMTLLYSRSP